MYNVYHISWIQDNGMVEGLGGMMPILITGTSQTGDLLGFISAIKMDGICSRFYSWHMQS